MMFPNYKAGWIHSDICARLERFSDQVIAQESPRLMLLVPPRHGKSELASIRFPPWHLGRRPDHEIVNVGYNMDLPMKFSRKVREQLKDPVYATLFDKTKLSEDSQSIEGWSTTAGGGLLAVGVGGGLTGKGAHILTIDDPIKNQEEADSVLIRDKLWDWYQSTAYTRLAPGGGVLLIQCMTGDTPVLMADGSYKRIDCVRPGDRVATWDNGTLANEAVLKQRSNGYDDVLALTTTSGTAVRANGRHPFLVDHGEGEFEWVRLENLKSGQRIVTVQANGGSGADFTTEEIVSIAPAGREEVFDLQINRTQNFVAKIIVTHNTWWHDDDLAGRLQNAMRGSDEADQFEIVKYPAMADTFEYLEAGTRNIVRSSVPLSPPPGPRLREPGEALHPDRYDVAALRRIKANLSPRIWSALYQQNPMPDEGVYFTKDSFRYQTTMPTGHGLRIYTGWDFAIGEKQQNDWTVGATIAQDHDDMIYVLNIVRFRGDSALIVETMLDEAEKWTALGAGYQIAAEDGQIWRAMKTIFDKRCQERKLYPPFEVMKPLTDKLVRARSLQGRMQHRKVVFPEHAAWKDQAVHEMLRFPAGVHDDVVDGLAWAVNLCLQQAPPRLPDPPKKLPSLRDKILMGTSELSHMAA